VTITPAPPAARFGQSVRFTATVTPRGNAVVPTGTLVFVVDGVPLRPQPLNAAGQTAFTTLSLPVGNHIIEARYLGDGTFPARSAKRAYHVSAAVTISGAHRGVVIVTGPTLISRAQILGPIVVLKGGSLDVENSTVAGSIAAADGASGLRICGTSIVGSVTVSQAAGLVVIGDPAIECAPNIATNLVVIHNENGVEVVDNTVQHLVASGNSGPGPYPGDVTTVTGNHS
jgi:hypothetical protein